MGLNPQSSSTSGPALPATPVTLEIEAVRNCVGRVYSFKPRTKRDSKKQHELHGDQLYHYHPVVVIHRQSDGRVHIVIITYSVDTTVDPRMHVPISGNHWNTTEGRPQVNLAKWRFISLSWESSVQLWDHVIEAERGFISKEDWEYQNTEKKVASAVSSFINRWTSVEQGQNQICKLQILQEKVKSLAAVVDECLDQHWLQPQRELQQSLSEQGRTLQEADCRQLDYEGELIPDQSQDQENQNRLIEAAEAQAIKRVETEILINEMTKVQNYKAGKRSLGQQKRLRRAVENIVTEEIRRRHREKVWKAAESTLREAGYSEDDLAFLECEWPAQVNSH
ncbi:hypothetical protein V491_02535 [Pseudogymnoascus sp. VKM F-3775]|nr:hypothetical protein V491_02535 [Pseudogymnoascus sp. VKM F-3775]